MDLMQYGLKPIDFQNPEPDRAPQHFTRRTFVMSSLAVGFAVAAQPLRAQAIRTDSKGLSVAEIELAVADGRIPAYVARPAKAGRHPVVLVVQEIFGVHEHIQDMCRRFAKLGYYAIAPELFARQGDVSKMSDINTILSEVVSKVPDAQVCADLDAAIAFAGASGHGRTDRVGLVGYCWGGRTAWIYALHNPKLKAAVAYYGLLEGMKSPIRPRDPIEFGAELKVPVLGLYASKDAYIKPEVVARMREAVAKSASGSELVIFPDVDHGFNADYRPTYDRAAAVYAWKLARNWLKDHGV